MLVYMYISAAESDRVFCGHSDRTWVRGVHIISNTSLNYVQQIISRTQEERDRQVHRESHWLLGRRTNGWWLLVRKLGSLLHLRYMVCTWWPCSRWQNLHQFSYRSQSCSFSSQFTNTKWWLGWELSFLPSEGNIYSFLLSIPSSHMN